MPVNHSEKISACLARAAGLRKRSNGDADVAFETELHRLASQWLEIAESYKFIEQAGRYLENARARRSAPKEQPTRTGGAIWPARRGSNASSAVNGASLANLLEVLVRTAIEHTDGKARAAFYLADPTKLRLHHVVGMPDAYASCVDGFAIGRQSLACGLAVATRQPILTPDVSQEPRWKQWLWLAEEFDYRACWSFPIATASGEVLGSFAMYYGQPREATPRDLDLASLLTRTAATIIARH
jgi:hypothetical protein